MGNYPFYIKKEIVMITISVCMIVKNEEDVLARSLQCAKQIADEIIVVDTGSEDDTKTIAQEYTPNIYDFTWCDDFSKARNFSFAKATMEYCMWLDADDIIKAEDIEKIKALKRTLSGETTIVMMKYNTAFDKEGNPTFSYYRERLIKREANLKWEGFIHEVIGLCGNVQYEDIAITHQKEHVCDPMRNIRIFESMLEKGGALNPREQFYYARELYYHKRYEDAIRMFTSFLKGGKGWIENNIDACEMISFCYYQLQQSVDALCSLYHSFVYDLPRAEICCDIGKHYFDRKVYDQAIYWYKQALECPRNDKSGAFIRVDCYGYIPCLQLSVCYYYQKDIEQAKFYNDQAGTYRADSKEVKSNKLFYDTL